MINENIILHLSNISKRYPGVLALNSVSLDIIRGEVHAIVGENGAGKSTLIKICSGAIQPDNGKIIICGKEFSGMTPKISINHGISIIYQEFNLIENLSIADNIFLGCPIRNGICVDKKSMFSQADKLFAMLDIDLEPNQLVGNLTVGYQQLVEIAKAVSLNAEILIMDEASAPLTNAEAEKLYDMIGKLKARGITIIYISHRMEEIFRLSDRVTVMRDGHKIKTYATADTDIDKLITAMVGRNLSEVYPQRTSCITDNIILETRNLCGNGLHNISFQLKKGEILGLGGLIGSGRTEIAELIFGFKPKKSGKIILNGEVTNFKHPKNAIDSGVVLIPEDRKRQGIHLNISISRNINMSIFNRISKLFIISKSKETANANYYTKHLKIKAPNFETKVKNLSGGNQQKVLIAKWLVTNPEIIILDEPTRGIDIVAKNEIYKIINELIESGKTILMISSEMEELMGMSDRILVLSEGQITAEINRDHFDQEMIMKYASKNQSKFLENTKCV